MQHFLKIVEKKLNNKINGEGHNKFFCTNVIKGFVLMITILELDVYYY